MDKKKMIEVQDKLRAVLDELHNIHKKVREKIQEQAPTHLIFVVLKGDYTIKSIYEFQWDDVSTTRFRESIVKKKVRGYFVRLLDTDNDNHRVYFSES